MGEKIIYNTQKRFSHIWADTRFIKQVNMFDKVMVRNRDSVLEGYVALISRKGINVNLGYGDRFFKWYNVMAVKKTISDLKKYVVVFYNPTACQTQIFRVEAKNEFRAGREFYRKYKRRGTIEGIYEV